MSPKNQRGLIAEDLYRLQLVSDCQISPDGQIVVFCVQRVDKQSENKYTNLWIVPAVGGQPRPFTRGDHTDKKPCW